MIDDAVLTSGTTRSLWRERVLRDTRQRLKRLEIETHRIKAELARLESENEHELADELTYALRLDGDTDSVSTFAESAPRAVLTRRLPTPALRVDLSPQRRIDKDRPAATRIAAAEAKESNGAPRGPKTAVKRHKKFSPAWTLSLGLHAAVLAVLAPMTYVILTNDEMPLFASMFALESPDLDEPGAAPIELVSFEEFEMPGDAVDDAAGLAESVTEEFTPMESDLSGETAANLGQLNTLPTDVGTLMAGGGRGEGRALGGGGGRGAAGDEARMGMTNFFGTPAKANCVVFLVDNSGSMKQGRMETTLFELARSVEALTEKQRFYVVFYSDQAYPMLYPSSVMEPLAATRENKERLYHWLQTVELCVGGALVKAMELAESLNPEVVYVLSDGNIASVRTMEKLTHVNDRAFAIHTLGMGVTKPQDAQNLAAIAQANRGTFQMVRPLPAAVQMAKTRPIRSNGFGVGWGEGVQQPLR